MLRHPPPDLASRPLVLDALPVGTALHRCHPTGHGPIWFGPGAGNDPAHRFDDPHGKYGVCYLGYTRMAASVATMLRDLTTLVIAEDNLPRRCISRVEVVRALRVVRAHSEGLRPLGATAAVSGAKLEFPGAMPDESYAHAMAWSRALHDHPHAPDGIAYHSSHDDSLACLALFSDRAEDALAVASAPMRLDRQKSLVAAAVTRYQLVLIPSMPR